MNDARFLAVTQKYSALRIAVVGDFCLDRYFEIDPTRNEISIETGLPVYNVVNTRCQPGAAGTILNNLVALGIGRIVAVGFAGEDGEGWELRRSLEAKRGVSLEHFLSSADRRTFTYTKPLLIQAGKAPIELNRLDIKNWSATPASLVARLESAVRAVAKEVDAIILLDQVDRPGTGVITPQLLATIGQLIPAHPRLRILADSRRSLREFPSVIFKMNRAELGRLLRAGHATDVSGVKAQAVALARERSQPIFITLAEQGIVGADPSGKVVHAPAHPVRGEIDIVGAGDAVTANLAAALAAEATIEESIELANAAASIVIHQLGTTGTASIMEMATLMRQG